MAIPQAVLLVGKIANATFGGSQGTRLEITNWNEVMKVLVKLDKTYVKELRSDFKRVAKDVQYEIKRGIPSKSRPPLSQMKQVHFGRLAWGSNFGKGAKPAKSVIVQTPNTRARKYRGKDIAIARVQIGSPATVLTDMAYRRAGAKGRKGFTPMYDYMYTIKGNKVPGKRKHRVTPGAFLRGLDKAKGMSQLGASRMIWPRAMKALPKTRNEIDRIVTEANMRVNMLLRSK